MLSGPYILRLARSKSKNLAVRPDHLPRRQFQIHCEQARQQCTRKDGCPDRASHSFNTFLMHRRRMGVGAAPRLHFVGSQVESEIIEITPSRSKPQQGIVTVRSTMFNQVREAVYVLTAKLLVLRRPRGK